MRALVQRVLTAHVRIEGKTAGSIGPGMLILLGVHFNDTEDDLLWVARKCANLRIFSDDEGKMNRSLKDVDGEALVVSQFTLYGDTRKGNRPSFVESAPPEKAEPMYQMFVEVLSQLLAKPIPTGQFGAMMEIDLVNEGPVTVLVERPVPRS